MKVRFRMLAPLLVWLYAGGVLCAQDAPGYFSRFVGGAKRLLPGSASGAAEPPGAVPPPSVEHRGAARKIAPDQPAQGARTSALPKPRASVLPAREEVKPAGWNATSEQLDLANRLAQKSTLAAKNRAVPRGSETKPRRTVSAYMAQERP
jgi:hypothetical protein